MPTKKNKPAKKTPAKKASPKAAPKGMALVALQPRTVSATLNITFSSGIGKLTAFLSRNGTLINMQSITRSSDIFFSDVKTGDGLALVGTGTGTTKISFTATTSPTTPETITGPVHRSYIVQ